MQYTPLFLMFQKKNLNLTPVKTICPTFDIFWKFPGIKFILIYIIQTIKIVLINLNNLHQGLVQYEPFIFINLEDIALDVNLTP